MWHKKWPECRKQRFLTFRGKESPSHLTNRNRRFRMLIQSAVRHVTPPLSSKRHLDAADNLSDQIKSLGSIWNRSSPGVRDAM
ncbi:hypothetical protein BBNG_00544 [Bifidobacterium bifidum NCIMB 41171]|nr:hypothetical protein BBNG_00544 [Bifidobacterium bifidum NCIMB 41171]